jgi:hypothetical protein
VATTIVTRVDEDNESGGEEVAGQTCHVVFLQGVTAVEEEKSGRVNLYVLLYRWKPCHHIRHISLN